MSRASARRRAPAIPPRHFVFELLGDEAKTP
jgi:hypothetical protein